MDWRWTCSVIWPAKVSQRVLPANCINFKRRFCVTSFCSPALLSSHCFFLSAWSLFRHLSLKSNRRGMTRMRRSSKRRRTKQRLKKSRRRAQQVTQFLEEMLQGVGPSVALGEDTKLLRRILDQTVGRVGKEMADQPEVEAELRNIIGGLYGELGYPGQAEKMVRQALAIHQKAFGSESLEAAASLNLLGRQLMGQYKRPEAARAYGEALAIRRRLLGQEHADTATSLSDLSAVYGEEGKVAEAEAMAREALRISRKVGGTNSSQVADVLRNLCMILGNGGKWAEAEETAREVLKMRRNLHR